MDFEELFILLCPLCSLLCPLCSLLCPLCMLLCRLCRMLCMLCRMLLCQPCVRFVVPAVRFAVSAIAIAIITITIAIITTITIIAVTTIAVFSLKNACFLHPCSQPNTGFQPNIAARPITYSLPEVRLPATCRLPAILGSTGWVQCTIVMSAYPDKYAGSGFSQADITTLIFTIVTVIVDVHSISCSNTRCFLLATTSCAHT